MERNGRGLKDTGPKPVKKTGIRPGKTGIRPVKTGTKYRTYTGLFNGERNGTVRPKHKYRRSLPHTDMMLRAEKP